MTPIDSILPKDKLDSSSEHLQIDFERSRRQATLFGDETGLSDPFIRRLETFGFLSDEDKAVLKGFAAKAKLVEARQEVIGEGDAPNGVVLILKGFAGRYKILPKGSRQITALLLPGDFCNLDVAFLPRMDHSIGTLSKCHVVRIAPGTVLELLQRPVIASALRMSTLLEMSNAREWLINLGQRTAIQRVAHLFCELHSRMEAIGAVNKDAYYMPLSQNDLSETVGMSYVHMNRSIKVLTKAGLINLRSKRMTIRDLPGLKIFGDFQADYLQLEDGPVVAQTCSRSEMAVQPYASTSQYPSNR